jgi:hypothetical protein
MAASFTIDASELDQLAADLGEVASSAGPYVHDAMQTTAIDITNEWRAAASGLQNLPFYGRSIGYDFAGFQGFGATVFRCDIGPDKGRRQGSFGAIVENGSPTSAPHKFGENITEAHTAQYEALLIAALEKAERALTFGGIVRSVIAGRNTIL